MLTLEHQTLSFDGIRMDVSRHRVTIPGRRVPELTRTEFELLKLLLGVRGRVLSREVIIAYLWPKERIDARTVDQHVARLRSKIGTERVRTVAGYGYQMAERS